MELNTDTIKKLKIRANKKKIGIKILTIFKVIKIMKMKLNFKHKKV